jgi:hypothetical protein
MDALEGEKGKLPGERLLGLFDETFKPNSQFSVRCKCRKIKDMHLLRPTTFRAPGMAFEIAKTFQNLSIHFLHPVLPVREKVSPGDPKKSAHPDVNADFGPYIRWQHGEAEMS